MLWANYVLVELVLGSILSSDGLADKEAHNGDDQNNRDESDLDALAGTIDADESHGGQEVSRAVTPEEVIGGRNGQTEEGDEVDNDHADGAADVSVIAGVEGKTEHSDDNEDGAYNVVPAYSFTKKLEGADLLQGETVTILVSSASNKTETGKNAHFEHNYDVNQKGVDASLDFVVH